MLVTTFSVKIRKAVTNAGTYFSFEVSYQLFILSALGEPVQISAHPERPLKNAPFCPISASHSNFNPRNTQCIPVVKVFVFSRSKSGIFDLNLHKIERFSKVSQKLTFLDERYQT